jgi:hypothetical protein
MGMNLNMREVRFYAVTYGFHKMVNSQTNQKRYFVGVVLKSFTGEPGLCYREEILNRQGRELERDGLQPKLIQWV